MQANRQRVDDNLFPASANAGSKYTRDYEENLGKIKQLQAAIRLLALIGDRKLLDELNEFYARVKDA